ncbi:MAG: DUF4185 domain-containing protein [Spirochaetaceae bacterium]|nr:MAG: DUF4185 domain-containing protein [Spirochaetaceae bacterium]
MSLLDSRPQYAKSRDIVGMSFTSNELVIGTGDMWPMTWADDDAIYTAAGDNSGFLDHFQTMNFWRIDGNPPQHDITLVNTLDFLEGDGYDMETRIPSIKPAGVVCVDGVLYLAIEDMRYTQGRFGNQINLQSWIICSKDHGKTWSQAPIPGSPERKFLSGVFASPHFLQFGRDYAGALDDWVYAYSSADEDGVAAWSAGSFTYLARVPRSKILDRSAWQFFAGLSANNPVWSKKLEEARPVFSYSRKTGENEVVYHPVLRRFLLFNWAFIDCVNHLIGSRHSELSIFESENPWGPWFTVYVQRDWGFNCDYQPRLPTKWIDSKNCNAWLVSAGNFRRDGGRQHYALVATPVCFNTGDFGCLDENAYAITTIGDFVAEALSDTEIKLSWLPVHGVGFYRILRDGLKHKDIPPQYPSRFIDKKLAPCESHRYEVMAMSPAGDVMAKSVSQTCVTLQACQTNSFGVNLGSGGFYDGTTMWYGEDSSTRFEVIEAGAYIDDRIAILELNPNPGRLEPALRSIRGEIPGVKILFRELQGKHVRVRVYALDSRLSQTKTSFEVWVQGTAVARYMGHGSSSANWIELGPFEADVGEEGTLLIEGQKFVGLGGFAAARVDLV